MAQLAERFEAALYALIGDGPIKQRLSRAYSEHLEDLEESELPASLRAVFKDLNTALHRVPPAGKETPVNASVQKMSFVEAGAHAGTIVQLYAELLRGGERAEPLKVVKSAKEPAARVAGY
jgi:hypothetical protein